MNDYAKGLPQDRKRLWLSSKRLDLVRYEGEKMSTFDALAAKKGWKKGELRWQMGSWGQRKPITKPAYTVTSGQHFMGSETLNFQWVWLRQHADITWRQQCLLHLHCWCHRKPAHINNNQYKNIKLQNRSYVCR